ncbi:hypothetical protein [Leptospira kmetyi]|uniref:hypothetical protein n=1 Tax=Leptospira kmetyi TaxID=408139 RepID=UPI003EC003B4
MKYILSLILFFISLLYSLAFSPEGIYLNSDILYIPTVALDVFRDGGNFLFWSFTPSPYFFPDFPIVSILLWIFGSAGKALVVFAFLQTILFTVLTERFWIYLREEKKRKPLSRKEARRVKSWVLVSISFLLLAAKNFPTLYILFLPSIHASAFLVTLYVWPLLSKTFKKREVWILSFWIALTIASDRILFVELVIPGILAGFLHRDSAGSVWKRFFPESSKILLVAGIIGLILHSILKSFLFIEKSGRIPAVLSFAQIVRDISRFKGEALVWFSSGGASAIPVPAVLISILTIAFFFALTRMYKTKSTSFLFFFFAILTFAPILTGTYIDEYSLRYAAPALILSPIFLVFVADFPKRGLTLSIFVLFLSVWFLGQKSPENPENALLRLFRTIPQEASCVDKIAKNRPISLVVSDFWNAKRIRVFSETKIPAVHVAYGTLEGSHTISNREWYLKDYPGTIAVLTEGLGEDRILEVYGKPSDKTQCGSKEFYFYEDSQKIREALRKPFQKTK